VSRSSSRDVKAETKLGALIAGLRRRKGWTLREMSSRSGIPLSTLAKVEHDRLTLTYDRLLTMSRRLSIPLSELLDKGSENSATAMTVCARRSFGGLQKAVRLVTEHYEHYYFCSDLHRKRIIPILTKVSASTFEETGGLIRHGGEQYIHVLSGSIVVHTEFYTPAVLVHGAGIYIDSNMGHAYSVADCKEATILGVYSGAEEDVLLSMKLWDGHKVPPKESATK
jgi:transcriptional regulator with XRE-family HTH domain